VSVQASTYTAELAETLQPGKLPQSHREHRDKTTINAELAELAEIERDSTRRR
jgi:hypothetical protein